MSLNSLENRNDEIAAAAAAAADNSNSNWTTEERVVLTPLNKTKERTVLLVERKTVEKLQKDKLHFAGGDHTGIVINKQKFAENINECAKNYHLSLEFVVFLCDATSGIHSQESRTLRFEFVRTDFDYASIAQQFFREIVEPREFPRDYVGFIKKIMKLLQNGYQKILKVEIELKKMQDLIEPLNRLVSDEDIDVDRKKLTEEKALEMIESSFPNPVTAQSIKKDFKYSDELENVVEILKNLETRGLIKSLENNAYTRAQHLDDVQIVKKIPHLNADKQPTIAIITAQYCEKLAVDSMIDNKETFVRFTTIGESNVYTLGTIGKHRVVSTKLPTIGHTREAMTAAGNTTTRLLGTFQKVDYIFLVGVAGGVPHFTDYNRHVRLGDVVISSSSTSIDSYVYLYANPQTISNASIDINANVGQLVDFDVKSYAPANFYLQKIARKVKKGFDSDTEHFAGIYKDLLANGGDVLKKLQSQHNFDLPSAESDKLYMSIGEKDMIQISHPNPDSLFNKKIHGIPRLHLTALASGRIVAKDDQIRQIFATKNNVFAFDCEFDTVIESIIGNCRDSFILIRGISDYKDGTCGKEWQPYASLVAAVIMKMVILEIPDPICE